MATEESFAKNFLNPLMECYGKTKFPDIRVKKIWEKVCKYPDHLLGKIANQIILTHDQFPGMATILNSCGEMGNEFMRGEIERIKARNNCSRCQSNGFLIINGFAYHCDACELGLMLYPAWPKYEGQVPFREKIEVLDDGSIRFENAKIIAYTRKINRINTEYRLILKDTFIMDKKRRPEGGLKKASFSDANF